LEGNEGRTGRHGRTTRANANQGFGVVPTPREEGNNSGKKDRVGTKKKEPNCGTTGGKKKKEQEVLGKKVAPGQCGPARTTGSPKQKKR